MSKIKLLSSKFAPSGLVRILTSPSGAMCIGSADSLNDDACCQIAGGKDAQLSGKRTQEERLISKRSWRIGPIYLQPNCFASHVEPASPTYSLVGSMMAGATPIPTSAVDRPVKMRNEK